MPSPGPRAYSSDYDPSKHDLLIGRAPSSMYDMKELHSSSLGVSNKEVVMQLTSSPLLSPNH